MRHDISTLERRGVNIGFIEVFLDGVKCMRPPVVAFDTGAGTVERLRYEDDKAVVEDGRFVIDTTEGRVEAFLTHAHDGRWVHAVPEPTTDRLPVEALIETQEGRMPNFHKVARHCLRDVRKLLTNDQQRPRSADAIYVAAVDAVAAALKAAWGRQEPVL